MSVADVSDIAVGQVPLGCGTLIDVHEAPFQWTMIGPSQYCRIPTIHISDSLVPAIANGTPIGPTPLTVDHVPPTSCRISGCDESPMMSDCDPTAHAVPPRSESTPESSALDLV